MPVLQLFCTTQGYFQSFFNQSIGKSIIVHALVIFIRTGYIQNLIALFYRIVIGVGVEETRTFPNDLGSAVDQQTFVSRKQNILPNSMHHVRADVNLLVTEIRTHGTARINIIHIE
ncbi:hypothetical protein D3C75_793250 [compost metagenome]